MKYTLSVLVENHPGVLSKVSGLFSRRAFNIDSLAVGITEDPGISRMTIVADGDEYIIEQARSVLRMIFNGEILYVFRGSKDDPQVQTTPDGAKPQ